MPASLIHAKDLNLVLPLGQEPLHILRDINIDVGATEIVAITGQSGSGKTSLLMLLAGLERATGGELIVAEHNLSELNEDKLAVFRRNTVGILFQHFHLIPSLTALENVSLALEISEPGLPYREVRDAAVEMLKKVGLGDRLEHRPGIMSGGEQQRVGLARALVVQPRLLLADEPTSSLDQDTAAQIGKLMMELTRSQKTAMLVITHDKALAKRADRRFVMDRGRLTAWSKDAGT